MTEDPKITIKHFKRGDRVYVQAQQIWIILVGFVMNSDKNPATTTMNYGDLAEKMGFPDRRAGHTLGRQLGIVGQLCILNKLPPLNVIVVTQQSGQPGVEVLLRDNKTVAQEQAEVMKQDWYSLRVPTTGTFRKVWEEKMP